LACLPVRGMKAKKINPLVTVALVAALCGCASGANPEKAVSSPSASGATATAGASILGASPSTTADGIAAVEMATATNTDGSAAHPASEFHKLSDHKIIAVLTLRGLPAGTKLSYVRYLDGKFVDSKSALIGASANHFYFTFAAVTGQSLAAGTYRLRLYVNERASHEVVYRVT
jgi:hypothetical protein